MSEWKENPVNDSYESKINCLKVELSQYQLLIKKGDEIVKTLEIEEPFPLYDERELVFSENGKEVFTVELTEDHDLDFMFITDAIEKYVEEM